MARELRELIKYRKYNKYKIFLEMCSLLYSVYSISFLKIYKPLLKDTKLNKNLKVILLFEHYMVPSTYEIQMHQEIVYLSASS